MSLTLNETFRVAAPPDRVWQFLKNPAEVVTTPSAKVDGSRSPPRFSGATTPSLSFAHSSSTACAVS